MNRICFDLECPRCGKPFGRHHDTEFGKRPLCPTKTGRANRRGWRWSGDFEEVDLKKLSKNKKGSSIFVPEILIRKMRNDLSGSRASVFLLGGEGPVVKEAERLRTSGGCSDMPTIRSQDIAFTMHEMSKRGIAPIGYGVVRDSDDGDGAYRGNRDRWRRQFPGIYVIHVTPYKRSAWIARSKERYTRIEIETI